MKQIYTVASVLFLSLLICSAQTKKIQTIEVVSTEQELKDLEQKWNEALVARDITSLKQILSDDFAISGTNISKETYLALIQIPNSQYTSAKKSEMKVRVYGSTAVVLGRHNISGKYEGADSSSSASSKAVGGGSFSSVYNFMDVWVKREDGQWQCVATASDQVKNAK